MKDNFEFMNFEITNDDNLFEKEHGLTPSLKEKLIKVHKKHLKEISFLYQNCIN